VSERGKARTFLGDEHRKALFGTARGGQERKLRDAEARGCCLLQPCEDSSLSDTHTNTHTHSHTHSLTHSLTHTLSLSHTHTLSLSHSRTHTHSLSLSHTHTHTSDDSGVAEHDAGLAREARQQLLVVFREIPLPNPGWYRSQYRLRTQGNFRVQVTDPQYRCFCNLAFVDVQRESSLLTTYWSESTLSP